MIEIAFNFIDRTSLNFLKFQQIFSQCINFGCCTLTFIGEFPQQKPNRNSFKLHFNYKAPLTVSFFAEGTPISFQHELQMKPLMLTYYNANQNWKLLPYLVSCQSQPLTDWLLGSQLQTTFSPIRKRFLKSTLNMFVTQEETCLTCSWECCKGIMVNKTCIK